MKILICVTIICSVFFIAGVSAVQSQNQMFGNYTMISSPSGPLVCMGRWVPPKDVALSGVCEGQLVDVNQLTAISTKMSADRLDQVLVLLGSIDQKLTISNDQVNHLLDATVKTQTSVDQQVSQMSGFLRETITERFEALPEEILANDQFREELARLKEDILKEVEKHYLKRPMPSKK